MAENAITKGNISKQLMLFFFPIWFGTFFQQLYNTADAVIVGNFVGKEALAAVGGPTATIINLLVGFFVGLSSGAGVIISQYYGGGDAENTNLSIHTAMAISVVGGVLLTGIGLIFSPLFLKWMGTPPEIMDYAVKYLNIYFLGIIFNLIYNIGSGVLRAIGDSKRPLYFLIVCSIINIVLDIVFVLNFNMGIAGVGYATVIAQAVSSILVVASLMKPRGFCMLELKKIKLHKEMLNRMFRIGIPAGMQSALYAVSNLLIQSGVNSFGTDMVAAWTAYSKIDAIYWMTINSFGIAMTTFVGQNFGAGQYDRIKKSIMVCLKIATVTTIALSIMLLITGKYLYRIFTPDTEIINLGLMLLKYLVPFYVTYVAVEIFSSAMRGVGDIFVPTAVVTLGICGLRVVWLFTILPVFHTIEVLMLSYPISWTVSSIIFIIYYARGKWLNNAIKKAEA